VLLVPPPASRDGTDQHDARASGYSAAKTTRSRIVQALETDDQDTIRDFA
jgi:hypothetical protein